MLEEMRIRDLGVIEDAVLELGPGLTVVTGETGAGKTMVVTGLGLLLGGRGDAGAVRAGASAAVVEGRVLVEVDGTVAKAAREAGGELDDDVLLIARSVSASGRSRAHVGGRSVPVSLLGELSADLVAVHGQAEQLRLLAPARQRDALDRFAGHSDLLEEYVSRWHELLEVQRRLDEVRTQGRQRAQEADLLRLGLADVEAVAPQPGEDAELARLDERLAHADALRAAAEQAHSVLQSSESEQLGDAGPDAVTLVGAARHALDAVRGHDATLAALDERLAEIGYLLADVAADLASYAADVESDPVRLAGVQERRAALTALTRKYGPDVDAVLAWAKEAAARLLELDDDDALLQRLAEQQDRLTAEVGALAGQLSRSRQEAAARLGALVGKELSQLAMPHATLEVAVEQRDDPAGTEVELAGGPRRVALSAAGADEVELRLSPHAGAPPRPVSRGASGGELSRIMLALEVVLAGADPVPTFVFDEVDAGVGGKAAVEIGRRLARLARRSQVLVVTHLPQVAAYADRHLLVHKTDDGTVTVSGVESLDDDGRRRELARMLAGLEESDTALAHADELLLTARGEAARLG
ncbi:MAG TPA: DNA repair protein RecN [Actinomycetales bacterium]|nr:DNA repair protein RecN [Actinomycetales bacterium]